MILGLHCETLIGGIEGRSFRHGPGKHHAVVFQSKVIVETTRAMLLHHELQPLPLNASELAGGFGGYAEAPLAMYSANLPNWLRSSGCEREVLMMAAIRAPGICARESH
jgi:hypothetical protein